MALLCPGPSLPAYPGNGDYPVVIGVNRAILHDKCDWWSVGDTETVTGSRIFYTPPIWTHEDTARRLRRIGWEGTIDTYPRVESAGWPLFSATAALMLAWRLGASVLDCYGVDMAGEADWDGDTNQRNRRDRERWQLERRIWAETVAGLEAAGITVTRHELH